MTHQHDVVKDVALIDLKVTLWSGRVKLYPDDLNDRGLSDLVARMPTEIVNLGSKRIFPGESLRPFNSHKYHASKLLYEHGFQSFSAHIVPRADVGDICRELDTIRDAFYLDREALKADYPARLAAWANHVPEWRDVIMAAAPSADTVYAKLGFDYRYILPESSGAIGGSDPAKIGTSLIDELMADVGADAQSIHEDCLAGKARLHRRSLNRLSTLQKKLEGFAFLDAHVVPKHISALANALDNVPVQGAIVGKSLSDLSEAIDGIRQYDQDAVATPAFTPIPSDEDVAADQETSVRDREPVVTDASPQNANASVKNQGMFAF